MTKKLLKKCAAAAAIALCAAGVQASTWTLTGDLVTHDPSVYKENSTWWITETSDNGIGVKFSADGHAWKQGVSIFGNGLSWWGQYNNNSKTVWAPDIHVWNGKAILYYAVSTFGSQKSAIGLATASSIAAGNWTDKGVVLSSAPGNNFNAIDPNFFVDKAGQPWLSFGSFWTGIYTTRVDANTLKPIGSWFHLASDSTGIENSFIMANGSYYYLFVSKGKCCAGANSTYHISYGRSTSVTGPYLDKNGVDMRNGGGTTLDAGGGRFIAPGGESVSNGVMVRHELDSQNNYNGVLFINDLTFSGGWPTY
ncbi:extracellular endo-alpha-(1-_5)-L-arabinanase 1 [Duganella caerulea]|uniref:family 43 glycosylhydrolase n=1 Tax=Duganella caerulea TaxID=2885762 RepID=UPI0030E908C2